MQAQVGRRQLMGGMLAAAGLVLLAAAVPSTTVARATTYTVRPGDTLWAIARAFGLASWEPIYNANRDQLTNPNLIHIGMVLVVPTDGEPAAGAPAGGGQPEAAPAPAAPAPPSTGVAEVCGFTSNWITDVIVEAAHAYGQSPCQMLGVAWCESRFDPGAYNRSSGASGLFQFLSGTWRSTPYAGSSVFNAWANAHAAAWMWQQGRRNEWVCLEEGLVTA